MNARKDRYALFGREMYELNDIVLNLNYWTAQPENVSKGFTTLQKIFLAWCDGKGLQ